jgi:branched-subunit amino acid transport protein AzlD
VTDSQRIAAVVAVAAAITWGLRAIPFAVLAPIRHSVLLGRLRVMMPLGIMAILTIYTVSSAELSGTTVITYGTALVVTAGLQVWRRNPGLSIIAGTAVHVVLTALLT